MGTFAALVKIPGGFIRQQPGGFDFGGHIGKLVLGNLELGDFFTELLPALDIFQGPVPRPQGNAQRLGGYQQPAFNIKLPGLIIALAPAFRSGGLPAP